jgi:hypothetical protein
MLPFYPFKGCFLNNRSDIETAELEGLEVELPQIILIELANNAMGFRQSFR